MSSSVRTVSAGIDKFKIVLAILLAVSSVVAFYALNPYPQWVRVFVLIGLVSLAVIVFLMAEPGRQFTAFVRESIQEGRKVVWPARKEAMQVTAYVFAFVSVMAIFLWLADKFLEFIIYNLILGWTR